VIGLASGEALTRTASVLSEELGCTVEAAFTSDHARLGADTADLASDIPASVVHDFDGRSIATLRVVDGATRFDDSLRARLSSAADQVAGLLAHVRDDDDTRRREQMFRDLVESAAEAIVGVSPSGTICYANLAAVRIFGFHEEELIGASATSLFPPPLSELTPRLIPRLMRRQARILDGRPTVVTGRRKDGSTVPLEITLAMREHDTECGCTASMRDITEHAAADTARERALRVEQRAARRLRSVADMRRNLLAAVYHELVEPLSVIQGLVGLAIAVEEWPLDEARYRPMLEHVHRASDQMSTVLTDLLALERFEHDELLVRVEDIDPRVLIEEVAAEPIFSEALIAVRGEPTRAWCDPALMRTVLRNLLKNAVRHSPADADIVAAVASEPHGVVIAVSDHGPGIPNNHRRNVFKPFWRGKSEHPGLGLGLTLVEAFVRAHGGRVWVEDGEEGGSTFKVLLPRPTR